MKPDTKHLGFFFDLIDRQVFCHSAENKDLASRSQFEILLLGEKHKIF